MRIQQVENAMFDLASSEAEHPDEIIKSLDNGNTDSKLLENIHAAYLNKPQFSPTAIIDKMNLMDEIHFQNLSDVSGWGYVEKHMPMAASYIIDKCIEEDLDLCNFIHREDNNHNNVRVIIVDSDKSSNESLLSGEEITKDSNKIRSTSLQLYLEQLSRNLGSDIKAHMMINDLEKRSQQVKDAAMPDTQKLSLIQRYRTADERQFSKTLGELLELQKRRKTV